MKIRFAFATLSLLALACFQRCDEPTEGKPPTIITLAITDITANTATAGGEVTADGNTTVTERGVCWSTNSEPTTEDNKTMDGAGIGSYSSNITGLSGNTVYFLRAYAINKAGISYGDEIEFTTAPAITTPILTTVPISGLTNVSALAGGNISDDGGNAVTARGVCWATSPLPTVANTKTTDGTGSGNYESALSGLTPATTYYLRAYATNAVGTAYSDQLTFTTGTNSITLYATKDASIFNKQDGTALNGNYGTGGSQLLQVGVGNGVFARTLVQFDLSSVPSGTVIESVSLEFTVGRTGTAPPIIYIHKMLEGWTEGTNKEIDNCAFDGTCNQQGAAIPNGGTDVTWNETSYSGTTLNPNLKLNPWLTAGGTFSPTTSATADQAGNSALNYSSQPLKTDVEGWITAPSTNFGWILKSEFNIVLSSAMRRFRSREGAVASGDATTAPRLIVNYH
jgi:hypothetical protein